MNCPNRNVEQMVMEAVVMIENYITVSEAARFYKKTTQAIYNMIHNGTLNAVRFNRGSMSGWLVERPADYNIENDYGKKH